LQAFIGEHSKPTGKRLSKWFSTSVQWT